MGHTPGPWSVSVDRISSDYGDIAAIHYQSSREQKGWNCMDDANLIAAAPELLERLRECVTWLEDYYDAVSMDDDEEQHLEAARAAIARAEGRSE